MMVDCELSEHVHLLLHRTGCCT